jgi:hypothetical protein
MQFAGNNYLSNQIAPVNGMDAQSVMYFFINLVECAMLRLLLEMFLGTLFAGLSTQT